MAISKSLLMRNGATATYWKIINIDVDVQGLKTTFVLAPFLDSTKAANRSRPIGSPKIYTFSVTEDQILTGTIDDAYLAILAKAASVVPNIGSSGTHIYDTDLADGTII